MNGEAWVKQTEAGFAAWVEFRGASSIGLAGVMSVEQPMLPKVAA